MRKTDPGRPVSAGTIVTIGVEHTSAEEFRTTTGLGPGKNAGQPHLRKLLHFAKQMEKISFLLTTIMVPLLFQLITIIVPLLSLTSTASASTVITAVAADPGRSASNPFDYTNITITSNSATYNANSDIRDIFGGSFSTMEKPGHTVFADNANAVTTYQVSFTTNAPVSLSGFSLYIREDGPGSINRSATNFQLKADGNVISNVALAAMGQTYSINFGGDFIKVTDSFAPLTASSFQATFTSNNSPYNGSRVYELDGIWASSLSPVPEPSAIRLSLLTGLVFVAFFRRRIEH